MKVKRKFKRKVVTQHSWVAWRALWGFLPLLLLALICVSGCNSGGGNFSALRTRNMDILTVQINPVGVNVNSKNTSELLSVVQNTENLHHEQKKKQEDTAVIMRSMKEKRHIVTRGMDRQVLKGPEDVSHIINQDISTGVLDFIFRKPGAAKKED